MLDLFRSELEAHCQTLESGLLAARKCPRNRLVFVGIPSEKDLLAVADEELPAVITPDFKTSVDDTEWRG